MAMLEKEMSLGFDFVGRELKELKGLIISLSANFLVPSTSFSFKDLFSHPPSPSHTDPEPSSFPIVPTSTCSVPPSVSQPIPPSTILALIPIPQVTPPTTLTPISQALSPISQPPPLPIPFTLPSFSSPPTSSINVGKKGEKNSSD
ncbi:proline-rich receptor-like protein kinase PERK13 [Neltuma alba]|uniref:proline-rich receptor-like protein kinase PERK13 n=1 Tax=Neltuma alba TaxID=207710 RepID=UPI0010A37EED|nr:proline-rich receptor-like protein kinase PERK13 [Prosopis alba]